MEKYIAILVFLVPGFIVSKINEVLGNKKRYKSDIKTIVEILGYDLLIFSIQICILSMYGYTTINQIIEKVGEFKFLLKLVACLIVISILVGIIVSFIKPKYTGIAINKVRKWLKKPPTTECQVWDTIINKGPCFMRIYKGKQEICKGGLTLANFSASEDKEILLSNGWLLEERPDLFDEKTAEVYYNIDKDLVIKIYDPASVIAESQKFNTN